MPTTSTSSNTRRVTIAYCIVQFLYLFFFLLSSSSSSALKRDRLITSTTWLALHQPGGAMRMPASFFLLSFASIKVLFESFLHDADK